MTFEGKVEKFYLTLAGTSHVHENSSESLLFLYDTLYVTTMSFSALLQSRWKGCQNMV